MARPLRIELPGAIYHVTSRGDRREPIFADDLDRVMLLSVVGDASERFDATIWSYCLMGNHYHFVLQTHQANLSRVMRHINGVYTQSFNARHGLTGHLFQGRFKAILVDTDAYLLEVCRYVELNPVRARMVRGAGEWPWSSYLAHVGQAASQAWLDTASLHEQLMGRPVVDGADRDQARRAYAQLVADGAVVRLWEGALRQQIYLGDDAFVDRMLEQAQPRRKRTAETPAPQRTAPSTWSEWLDLCGSRNEALRRAHVEGGLSMTELARATNLSVGRVSRLIRRQREAGG